MITRNIHSAHAHRAVVIMCDQQYSRDLRYKDNKVQNNAPISMSFK